MKNHRTAVQTSLLLICLSYIPEILSFDCYSCRGINCQRTTRINDTVTCPNAWDECVSILSAFSVLERGCYSSLPEMYRKKCDNLADRECLRCFGDLCNSKGAAKCIQCSSIDQEKCVENADQLHASHCPVSTNLNSYCFVRLNSKGHVERGCLTNLVEQTKCLNEQLCSMCLPGVGVACNSEFKAIVSGATQIRIYGLLVGLSSLVTTLLWTCI